MKLIYLLVCLPALLALPPTLEEIKANWRGLVAPYESECACESGADPSVIQLTFEKFTYSNDPCLKCYFSCVIRKLGLLYPNGTINIDAYLAIVIGVPNEKLQKCIARYDTCPDQCHGLWAFSKCTADAANLTTDKLEPPCPVS